MDNGNNYMILFEDTASEEFKMNVLKTLIDLYNQGIQNLGLIAELTLSICLRDDVEKTAKFIYVGI